MHVTLVHNAEAGQAQPSAESLIASIEDQGHRVRYVSTAESGWRRALDEPADLVAAAGGDGTVASVLIARVDLGAPVAILPLGTANNIAAQLGIDRDLEAQIAGWSSARRQAFDIGALVSGARLPPRFVEAVGAGFLASAINAAERSEAGLCFSSTAEHLRHDIGALLDRLEDEREHRFEVRIDGRSFTGDYLAVEVMNTPMVGPNLVLAPGARVDDGLLDVVLISERHRRSLEEHLACQLSGEPPPSLPSITGREIELVSGDAPIHIDGATWGSIADPIELRVGSRVEVLANPIATA